jgi:hypothetical protein
MKYSRTSYLCRAASRPGGSDVEESNIRPGPVISADTDGIATAVGCWGMFAAGPPPRCPLTVTAIPDANNPIQRVKFIALPFFEKPK